LPRKLAARRRAGGFESRCRSPDSTLRHGPHPSRQPIQYSDGHQRTGGVCASAVPRHKLLPFTRRYVMHQTILDFAVERCRVRLLISSTRPCRPVGA